jgi:hypothetical protein
MSKPEATKWKECKAIAEALAPTISRDPMQSARDAKAILLAQVAAGSEKGANFAARFANTDGPIEVADEDVPEELRDLFPS